MSKKDVIYLDVEDDITAVIDKVKASSAAIIAIVPPKRANMLSSVVNLRLLKRAAESEDKKVVLITDEQVLNSMAGGIGMFVAANLTSAPQIPKVDSVDLPSDVIDIQSSEIPKVIEPEGQAINAQPAEPVSDQPNTELPKTKKKPNKKTKVPDIGRFRKFIFIGIIAVLLICVGFWWAFFVAPRAKVTLTAQTTDLALDTPVVFSTNTTEVDGKKNIIPAKQRETSDELSEEFNATGEKNIGEKAGGTMTLSNSASDDPVTVSAGTVFTASNGFRFTSSSAVTVPGGSIEGGKIVPGKASVDVVADTVGDAYNLSARSYTSSNSNVSAQGSTMTGGTNKLVKIISKEDVDGARESLVEQGKLNALEKLKAQFDNEGLIIIDESLSTKRGEVAVSPAIGAEAAKGIVKETVTYTLLAVEKTDYRTYLEEKLASDLKKDQKIVDYDEKDARFELKGTSYVLSARPKAGPDIDLDELANELAGKKFSDAVIIAEDKQDVSEAKVRLSPFWVFSVPKNPEKITITIESPNN